MEQFLVRLTEKKSRLDVHKPLPPELVKNLHQWFRVELTYTSNALEGNTLTHSETALVLEKGITIGGKTIAEHLEAVNHAQAIDFIMQLAQKNQAEITLDDLLDIHRKVLQKIDDNNAGFLRKVAVRIMGSRVPRPNYLKVSELVDEFVLWLNNAHDHPAKIAADAHLKFVFIHPFVDGNGRTARLLLNLLLLQAGYPLVIISNQKRKEYIDALEKSFLTGQSQDFYTLIYEAVESSLDQYLEAIEQSE